MTATIECVIDVVHRNQRLRSIALADTTTLVVGSGKSCGLVLDHPSVSPIHCTLSFQQGEVVVQDWISSTGTQLNQRLVDGAATAQVGDCVQLGEFSLRLGEARQCISDFDSRSADITNAEPSDFCSEQALRDSDPPRLDRASGPMDPDPCDEREQLIAEVVDLQQKLEEQEAQIAALMQESNSWLEECGGETAYDFSSPGESTRIDELIDELKKGDERILLLEEMVAAADLAADAEQEERRQLEAWLSHIEQRVGERESEYIAEKESLNNIIRQLRQERDQAEARLESSATAHAANDEYKDSLIRLRSENEQMKEKLADAEQRCLDYQQQLNRAKDQQASGLQIEEAVRAEKANLARERAELTRQRVDLANQRAELHRQNEVAQDSTLADARVRTLRNHLKEIQSEETKSPAVQDKSLFSRVTELWKRLDGSRVEEQ